MNFPSGSTSARSERTLTRALPLFQLLSLPLTAIERVPIATLHGWLIPTPACAQAAYSAQNHHSFQFKPATHSDPVPPLCSLAAVGEQPGQSCRRRREVSACDRCPIVGLARSMHCCGATAIERRCRRHLAATHSRSGQPRLLQLQTGYGLSSHGYVSRLLMKGDVHARIGCAPSRAP